MSDRSATILAVEDNPIARRLVRAALVPAGFVVVDAPDGATALRLMAERTPDLVLQDLRLPDVDGYELVQKLRALPGGREVPILAFSGFLSASDEARLAAAGFDDLVTKPVEPSALVRAVLAHLPAPRAVVAADDAGPARRVLVVDDDPVQRKLTRLRLAQRGYEVLGAADGAEALEVAARTRVDAIVTDALMPRMDGFELCIAARADAALAGVPIVLATASYVEEADRRLARQVGADAFVLRTPDLKEVLDALEACLRDHGAAAPSTPPPPPPPPHAMAAGEVRDERSRRVLHQLERQVALNGGLARQCSMLAAEVAVLSAISGALIEARDTGLTVHEILASVLDASGAARGAILVGPADGALAVESHHGFAREDLARLERALDRAGVRGRLADRAGDPTASDFVVRDGAEELGGPILVLPLALSARDRCGALALAAHPEQLPDPAWRAFARSIAAQVAVALALALAFRDVAASEQRRRALMEHAHDAIFVADERGRVVETNVAGERLLGVPRAEIVGRDLAALVPLPERPAPGDGDLDARVVRPDGRVVPVECSTSRVEVGGASLALAIVRDVSESRALAAQLRQAQKMEAIGQLAGGIAHDFNNLLAIITSYTDLVLEDLPPDATSLRDDLEQVRRAASSAASLTRQLLAFSRRQALAITRLDVNAVITGLEKMLRRLVGEDVVFETRLAPALWPVVADPSQVEQVVLNLVVNARDAMPRGGRLTIATANVELGRGDAGRDVDAPPGEFVALSVADTGVGIDAATRSRIFEPFFTTKEVGKGTGLGLATVHGIVRQSGGAVAVASEPGRGTTFTVYLPRSAASSAAASSAPPPTAAKRAAERVVVVEDDHALRAAMVRILEQRGYEVAAAESADAVIARWGDAPSAPADLFVTDLVMPGMGGAEFAARVAASWPGTRVLVVTGHGGRASAVASLDSAVPLLEKPFTLEALAGKVREVLDAPPPR